MTDLERVMADYGITPTEIATITEQAYYISNGQQEYFLKKSALSDHTLPIWENVFHQAYRLNLPGIMPVYVTKNNQLYCKVNNDIYYLTPWKTPNDKALDLESFYKYLAKIHDLTRIEHKTEPQTTIKSFEIYLSDIDTNHRRLLAAVEEFERNKYMAPFELMICTQYMSLVQVLDTLKTMTQQFIDQHEEVTTWRLSLCHGQLTSEHIIQSEQLLLVNWEKAAYHHPVYDLNIFLENMMVSQQIPMAPLIDHFDYYLDASDFSSSELYLLVIYLLDVQKYITILLNYLKQKDRRDPSYSMIEQIMNLSQVHRKLMLGLKFAEMVNKRDSDALLDDLES